MAAPAASAGRPGLTYSYIHDWVKSYEQSWTERFEALDELFEELKEKEEGDGCDDE